MISFAEEDWEIVSRLKNDLLNLGFDVWNYIDDIGEFSILSHIDEAISAADYVIVALSKYSLNSAYVMKHEAPLACQLEIEYGRPRVIPIRLDDSKIPPMFMIKNCITFSIYESGMKRLERLLPKSEISESIENDSNINIPEDTDSGSPSQEVSRLTDDSNSLESKSEEETDKKEGRQKNEALSGPKDDDSDEKNKSNITEQIDKELGVHSVRNAIVGESIEDENRNASDIDKKRKLQSKKKIQFKKLKNSSSLPTIRCGEPIFLNKGENRENERIPWDTKSLTEEQKEMESGSSEDNPLVEQEKKYSIENADILQYNKESSIVDSDSLSTIQENELRAKNTESGVETKGSKSDEKGIGSRPPESDGYQIRSNEHITNSSDKEPYSSKVMKAETHEFFVENDKNAVMLPSPLKSEELSSREGTSSTHSNKGLSKEADNSTTLPKKKRSRLFLFMLLSLVAAIILLMAISVFSMLVGKSRILSLLSPANGSTNQNPNTLLRWKNPNGSVESLYNLFLGTQNDPPLLISRIPETEFSPILCMGTKYFWRVEAIEDGIPYKSSPIWTFETQRNYSPSVLVPDLIVVKRGSFTMGNNSDNSNLQEKPVHEVRILYDFFIGKYEVTFGQYEKYCSATGSKLPDDSNFGMGDKPIINVSWWDAVAYCNWLSDTEHLPRAYDESGSLIDKEGNVTGDLSKVAGYRLPTEAEWEYAATGGNNSQEYLYSGGNNANLVAWYELNSTFKTNPVGSKFPNELGIHDMSGNVWEWCTDWYASYSSEQQTNPYSSDRTNGKVYRGGSWDSSELEIMSTYREGIGSLYKSIYLGFRVAKTVTEIDTTPNTPPDIPSKPFPHDGSQDISTDVELSWNCSDNEDDRMLKYKLYLDTEPVPQTLMKVDLKESKSKIGNLEYDKKYFWRVIAIDSSGALSPGPVWSFKTTLPFPQEPKAIYPLPNSEDIKSGTLLLRWEASEESASYFVEFDEQRYGPTKDNFLSVSAPARGKSYFWKVIAINEWGKKAESDQYSFVTKPNENPEIEQLFPENNSIASSKAGIVLKWISKDEDDDSLTYKVYFGETSDPPLVATVTTEQWIPESLEWGRTYFWRLEALDGQGGSVRSESRSFSICSLKDYESSNNVPKTERVERGSFEMGDYSATGFDREKPLHTIILNYDFCIGKYEITFEEYDAFCSATSRKGPGDEGWGRGSRPVVNVSWNDAIAYCNWLSEKEKLPKAYDSNGNLLDKDGRITTDPLKVVGYRLPTEAEWEFAAKGGHSENVYKYSGSDDINEVAWYYSNSFGMTHEVGRKDPNDLGLYDMSGNVWEWCSDWYHDDYYSRSPKENPYDNEASFSRVVRGGGFSDSENYLRNESRFYYYVNTSSKELGFRISRTIFEEASEYSSPDEIELISPKDKEVPSENAQEVGQETVLAEWIEVSSDELCYEVPSAWFDDTEGYRLQLEGDENSKPVSRWFDAEPGSENIFFVIARVKPEFLEKEEEETRLNMEVVEEFERLIAGKPGIWIELTAPQWNVERSIYSHVYEPGDDGYCLSVGFAAKAGFWSQYEPVLERIMETLRYCAN